MAVIVCSGYADIQNLKERLGDVPTLAKPGSPMTLKALMHKHFERAEAGARER